MKPFLLVLAFVLPIAVFAQTNYKPGYIVKSSGDTVRGFINYREWEESPRTIEFKAAPGDKPSKFQPVDLRSFTITGLEDYLSYKGLVTKDPERLEQLTTGADTARKLDTVFLRVVAAGPNVTLLTNTDKIRTRFFVKESAAQVVELIHHEYYVDQTALKEDKYYLIQLLALVHKYRGVDENRDQRLANMRYTEADLLRAIKVINGNQGLAHATGSGTRFFVGVAGDYSKVTIEGQGIFANPSNKGMFAPYIDLGLDFFNNKNVQRFVFRGELSYSYVSGKFNEETPSSEYQGNTMNYYIKQNNFTITPQIIYNVFNTEALKWYLGAGVSFNISTYPQNKTVEIFGDRLSDFNYYPLRNFWVGLPLQTGFMIQKRIELFAAYDVASAYYSDAAISVQNVTMRAGVRVHLAGK